MNRINLILSIMITLLISSISHASTMVEQALQLNIPNAIYVQDYRYPTEVPFQVTGLQQQDTPYYITVSRGGYSDYNNIPDLDRLSQVNSTRFAQSKRGHYIQYHVFKSIDIPIQLEDVQHAFSREQVIEGDILKDGGLAYNHTVTLVVPKHQKMPMGLYEDVINIDLFEGTVDRLLDAKHRDRAQLKIQIKVSPKYDVVLDMSRPHIEKGWVYVNAELTANQPCKVGVSLQAKDANEEAFPLRIDDHTYAITTKTTNVLVSKGDARRFFKVGVPVKQAALLRQLKWVIVPVR